MEKNNNNYKKNKNSLSKDFSNDSNIIKMKTSFNSKNLMHYKKLRVTLIVVILILLLLIVRIGFLQFVQGNYLKELAYNQQTINQIISPKRGNIYDSTGKALAISAQVDTITINPNKLVKNSNDETKEFREKIAYL